MIGFGFCLWWKLSNHSLIRIGKHFSEHFQTATFEPHISIRTKMSFIPSELPYPTQRQLYCRQKVRATGEFISSWNKHFYALELPVEKNDWYLPPNAHISLAYRFDRPFTNKDIAYAQEYLNKVDGYHTISKDQIKVEVYDVRKDDIYSWHAVK